VKKKKKKKVKVLPSVTAWTILLKADVFGPCCSMVPGVGCPESKRVIKT